MDDLAPNGEGRGRGMQVHGAGKALMSRIVVQLSFVTSGLVLSGSKTVSVRTKDLALAAHQTF